MFDLQDRHKKIIHELISGNDWMKGNVLAEKARVTPRTIRSDIAVINHLLHPIGYEIQSSRKDGYRISGDNIEKLSRILNDGADIPNTPRDRIKKLSIRLLLADRENVEYLDDLEEEMYISRATLENSIYKIKAAIENRVSPLFLQRERGKVWTAGEEETRRFLLKELIVDRTEPDYFTIEKYDDYFGKEVPEKMMEVVLKALNGNGLMMTAEDTLHLVIFLAIKITRIFQGKAYDGGNLEMPLSSDENSRLALSIVRLVKEEFRVTFNDAEQIDLMIQISLMRLIGKEEADCENVKNDTNHYEFIVNELLDDIKKNFFIDLTDDFELKQGLIAHIQYMVKKRAKHLQETEKTNPVLTLFKTEYPFVFDMALFIYEKFFDIFGLKLNEDELGYVATYLGAAIVKMENSDSANHIKMAVVTGLNYGAGRLLVTRLKSMYGNTCSIVGPFSPYNIREVEKLESGIVVSTESKQFRLENRFVQIRISPLVNSLDQNKISEEIQKLKKESFYERLPNDIRSYFREELFFQDLCGRDYRDIIVQMAGELIRQGIAEEVFLKKTLAREEISSTIFGKHIAMPHPIEPCAKSTVISVGILREPIEWGDGSVRLVFLLAVRPDDLKYLNGFFELIIRLMANEKLVDKLLKAEDFEDFRAMLPNMTK